MFSSCSYLYSFLTDIYLLDAFSLRPGEKILNFFHPLRLISRHSCKQHTLYTISLQTLEEQENIKFDPQKGWERFSKRVEEEQYQAKRRRSWLGYAAAAFIPVALAAVLFFSNSNPPSQNATNCITRIQANTGEVKKVTLPDGSVVWLNAQSEINYSCSFKGKAERSIALVKGEAYFEVKHDQEIPFVVQLKNMKVKVYGTTFNINTYNNRIKTTLISGSIGASSSRQQLRLKPGQQAVLDPESQVFSLKKVTAADDALWHTGVLNFDNASLQEIAAVLERQYGYRFAYQSPELATQRFTLRTELNSGLPKILAMLEKVSGFQFTLRQQSVFVNHNKP